MPGNEEASRHVLLDLTRPVAADTSGEITG